MSDSARTFPIPLPEGFDVDELMSLVPADMWEQDEKAAAVLALRRSGKFDEGWYLNRYPDVRESGMGAIEHYICYGSKEGRNFDSTIKVNKSLIIPSTLDKVEKFSSPINNSKNVESLVIKDKWSAIITMWKRKDYLKEQLLAIRGQSIPPQEIIIILNEDYISENFVRNLAGSSVKIIHSDINSLYSRWALSYIAMGEYIAVFDDDVIPGKYWIANATRACSCYNALVGATGRIFNTKGKQGFFKLVIPNVGDKDETVISCSETDIFCDWVCNSYLFKREWVGYILGQVRYRDSYKTFDDIQLSAALFLNGGIRCVTPMQPAFDKRLHGSLRHEYGNDAHAIWKSNAEHHFSERKIYIENIIKNGYIPVQQRENLTLFHIIVPFGERKYLERCLLSIKGQCYHNYTCTLIDDCCDDSDARELVQRLGMENQRFRYIKTTKKFHPLRSREIATDMLEASLADVIVHLDGDDWFTCSSVLSRLDRVYRNGNILVTYGNALCLSSHNKNSFQEYTLYNMSKEWNVAQIEKNAPVIPFRKIKLKEIDNGWINAPWCGMHVRSFRYVKWLGLNRNTFKDNNGEYLKVATDAAILCPILDSCCYNSIEFIPDIASIYQNIDNTIHAKKIVSENKKVESLAAIANAEKTPNYSRIFQALINEKIPISSSEIKVIIDTLQFHFKIDGVQNKLFVSRDQISLSKASAIVTIVTPDYFADAIICVVSYLRNLDASCEAYIFVATNDKEKISALNQLFKNSMIHLIFTQDLKYTKALSVALEKKYNIQSDEYRWAMKSVVLIELLRRGISFTIFLDPDIYTVNNITDIHNNLMHYHISLFPHFRDPDDNYLRKILYKDGFFNAGIIAANSYGISHLFRMYQRCLHKMKKDIDQHYWDDQKYLDLFTIEVENLFVNHDRGIDYNPWNYESVEDLIAPSQTSMLLKSGYFVRNWHMSTMFIDNSISIKQTKYLVYRPIVSIYLMSILYIIILLVAKIKDNTFLEKDILGLLERYNNIEKKITKISPQLPVREIRNILNMAMNIKQYRIELILKEWYISISNSICFDNFELFARLIDIFFHDYQHVAHMAQNLRKQDLRYLTEEIVGSPTLNIKEKDDILSEDVGFIVKKRLHTLRSSNIKY